MDTASGPGRALRPLTLTVGGTTLLALTGCIPGNAQPPTPQTKATVVVSHTIPGDTTAPCTGTAAWRLTPVSLSGSEGDSDEKIWTTEFEVSPDLDSNFGDRGHSCRITHLPDFKLRVGKWRFATVIGPYAGVCDVNLHVGGNSIAYHEVTKCSAG